MGLGPESQHRKGEYISSPPLLSLHHDSIGQMVAVNNINVSSSSSLIYGIFPDFTLQFASYVFFFMN